MSPLAADRETPYKEGKLIGYPVAAAAIIYAGSLVCINASGFAEPATDAVGKRFVGVAQQRADNSAAGAANGDVWVKVLTDGLFQFDAISITQAMVGQPMYIRSDHEFDESSTNAVVCGTLAKYESATLGWLDIELAVVTPAEPLAADDMTVGDPASLYTGLTVKTQLQEVMQAMKTAQYLIQPAAITLETGAPTVVFANGAADGFTQLTNKEIALRWNNGANPTKMAARFIIPPDLDNGEDLIVHLLGAIIKAGADEADSPTFTLEGYFAALGAAMLADTDCGGVSGEFLTTQTNKYQEKTFTIAAADIPAVAAALTLIFNPTDGELPADDFVLAGIWLEGTRKALTT